MISYDDLSDSYINAENDIEDLINEKKIILIDFSSIGKKYLFKNYEKNSFSEEIKKICRYIII